MMAAGEALLTSCPTIPESELQSAAGNESCKLSQLPAKSCKKLQLDRQEGQIDKIMGRQNQPPRAEHETIRNYMKLSETICGNCQHLCGG